MIRYRFPGVSSASPQVAACMLPALARLRPFGPWMVHATGGLAELTMQVDGFTPGDWGPWEKGIDGCEYAVAANAALEPLRRHPVPVDAIWVDFVNGTRAPVLPATNDGCDLDFEGNPLPSSPGAYFKALNDVLDAGSGASWKTVLQVCYQAMRTLHRCPPELMHKLRLATSADAVRLLQAASGPLGKAAPAAAG